VWRGPNAAAAMPAAEQLRGTVEEHALDSPALGAPRQVTVYRPPGPAGPRRPDVFATVAAFSIGIVPHQITSRARTARVRHYLAAGTLEAGFRSATRQWAERLRRAGLPCRYQEWIGGHDSFWWDQQLPAALAWLLAPPPGA